MEVDQLIYLDGILFSPDFVMLIALENSFKCVICCVIFSFTLNLNIYIFPFLSSTFIFKKDLGRGLRKISREWG
jgi:hypothetical protein